MNLNILMTKISSLMMNSNSSVFLGADTDPGSATSIMSILSFANGLISFLGEVLYSITKWVLYFVDILFFYIQQLAGLNMDTTSLNKMISKDADMVFNFLLSNSDMIVQIVKNLIVFSVILLIVFTIFTIIKNQFDSLKTDKSKSVADVMKTTIKSILLMLITPMIAIFGIVASNILLKALYNATDVARAASLGTQIFSAASNSANMYRQYAMDQKRVPIVFDFTKEEEILQYYIEEGSSIKMQEYLKSTDNTIYATYLKFADEDFDTFEALEADSGKGLKTFYEIYDRDATVVAGDKLYDYKRIRAYNEEYHVMADLVDYAVTSSAILHIKTVEEMLNSIVKMPNAVSDTQKQEIFNDIVSDFKISLYLKEDLVNPVVNPSLTSQYDTFVDRNWDVIRWANVYYGPNEDGEAVNRKQIQYNHVKAQTDESLGAVFILTGEKTINVGGVDYSYYYPVSRGYAEDGAKEFESEYIEKDQMVAAKGIFNADGYPTAIKKSKSGSEVLFYRDKLEAAVIGESGEVFKTDFQEEDGGVISQIVNFFKKLFDPSSWLPNLSFNDEEMMTTYTKVTVEAGKLDGGEFHIGYLFTDKLTSAISGDTYGLKLYTLFNPLNLNYLVLVMGSFLLVKVCFLAIGALIKRAYDLLLIIMIYPVTCATMPVDNGSAYSQWVMSYTGKLFSTYGLILGINFVLLLFPILNTLEFFRPEDIAGNKAAARFSSIFAMVGVSINTQTKMLNFVLTILFQLVAFSFLDDDKKGGPGIYSTIMSIVNPNAKEDLYAGNPSGQMMKTVTDAAHMVGKGISYTIGANSVFSLLTDKGRKRFAAKVKPFVPGSAILNEMQQKADLKKKMQRVKDLQSGKMSDEDKKKYKWDGKSSGGGSGGGGDASTGGGGSDASTSAPPAGGGA